MWPKFLRQASVCTHKLRAFSKRTFYVLSNGVQIDILLCPNYGRKFGQNGHVWPKFLRQASVCTQKLRAFSKRTFYALSNGVQIDILLCPNYGAENFVKVGQNVHVWPKFLRQASVCTQKLRAFSKRTFYALWNGVQIDILLCPNYGQKILSKLVKMVMFDQNF